MVKFSRMLINFLKYCGNIKLNIIYSMHILKKVKCSKVLQNTKLQFYYMPKHVCHGGPHIRQHLFKNNMCA